MSLKEAHRLLTEGEPDKALTVCSGILNKHMDDEIAQQALFMSAYIMLECERYGLAWNLYQRCAQLCPDRAEIWNNMGMCVEDFSLGRSRACFERALSLNPEYGNAWANLGLVELQQAHPVEAVRCSEKALKYEPDSVSAKHNMALAKLMLRDWSGWQYFNETAGCKHRELRDYGLPEWDGQRGAIIVYGEQGVGDEIMYASCLADLLQTNDVILDCDARLETLFRRSFGVPTYGTRFKRQTPILDEHSADYQIAIGQLPYYFRSNGEFPGTPYLKPDPERQLQWRALFDSFPGLKIGIAWTGGLPNTGQKRRSMELDDLKPIFSRYNTYISLEYNPVEQSLLDGYGIKSYKETRKGGDIDDLAALVSELDLVVTACTTVVYVAGALGVPCHVLVPNVPGYRYHLDGDFPWYKSVKLHRQKGTWRQTVANNLHWVRSGRDSSLPCPMSINSEPIKPAGAVHPDQQAEHSRVQPG